MRGSKELVNHKATPGRDWVAYGGFSGSGRSNPIQDVRIREFRVRCPGSKPFVDGCLMQ